MDPLAATPQPQPKVSIIQKLFHLFSWFSHNKKLTLVLLSVIFLLAIIIWIIIQVFGKNLLPYFKKADDTKIDTLQTDAKTTGILRLETDKSVYGKNEVIKVSVFGDSKIEIIRGFDILVSFDPDFLSLTDKRAAPLSSDFHYYGTKKGNSQFRISAVQELRSKKDFLFTNTLLYEFELQSKKLGKTSIMLVQSPNLLNESNLINNESKDILGIVGGKEIEIR